MSNTTLTADIVAKEVDHPEPLPHSCEDHKETVWWDTRMYQGDLVSVTRHRCNECGKEWTEAPWM
jgi:DNA-directed RNA polymerase subunit M/transcription elongation factor TFIIS